MKSGLNTTFEILEKTKNETAVKFLLGALDLPDAVIRKRSLRALIGRKSLAGHKEILRRWHDLGDEDKEVAATYPGRISEAIRWALLDDEYQLCNNGCEAMLRIREYELMPVLVGLLMDSGPEGQATAKELDPYRLKVIKRTLLEIASLYNNEQHTPSRQQVRRNLSLIGENIRNAIEPSLLKACRDGHTEIIEAYLLISNSQSPVLVKMLHEKNNVRVDMILDVLEKSHRRGIVNLLLEFLQASRSPLALTHPWSHRCDHVYLRALGKLLAKKKSKVIEDNLRKISNFPWISDRALNCENRSSEEQQLMVTLAIESGMNRSASLDVVSKVLASGDPQARLTAASTLVEFDGEDVGQLLTKAVSDDAPDVKACVANQLRERDIPGAMDILVAMLESTQETESRAAQLALSDLTMAHCISQFEKMEEHWRSPLFKWIAENDSHAEQELRGALNSPNDGQRLRALEIISAAGIVEQFEEEVTLLLAGSGDHIVRIEAALALEKSTTSLSRNALRSALMDENVAVQETARNCLKSMTTDTTDEECALTRQEADQ